VTEPERATMICSNCGTENGPQRTQCWLCREPIGPADQPPAAMHTSVPAVRTTRTFSLSSLMLLTALAAVCLGVMRQSLGLGIVLAILATPALLRTVFLAQKKKGPGGSMSSGEKVATFIGALAVVTTIGAAACVAFVAICFPIGLATFNMHGASSGVALAFLFGIAAGLGTLALGIWLWLFRPKRKRLRTEMPPSNDDRRSTDHEHRRM